MFSRSTFKFKVKNVSYRILRLQSTKCPHPIKIHKSLDGIFGESNLSETIKVSQKVMLSPPDLRMLDAKLEELKSKPIDFHYYLRSINQIQNSSQLPYKFGYNQLHLSTSDSSMNLILRGILEQFNEPIEYGFGYGSKVFSQGSSIDISNSQIDMIYAVSNPINWHNGNMKQHYDHYSGLKYFGSGTIARVSNLGAGVYFNPFVDVIINDIPLELKYGVTSTDNLMDDLTNWSTMYLSGRLHKPVAIIKNSPSLSLLNQFNLSNAVKLSLLLLNKTEIKESELYLTIAGLSYMGDPRLKVKGENPNKVKNIVENQFTLFKDLYEPIIHNYYPQLIQIQNSDSENILKVNLNGEKIAAILSELPKSFRKKLFNKFKNQYSNELSRDPISQNVLCKFDHNLLNPLGPSDELSYMELNDLTDDKTHVFKIPIEDWEYLSTDFKVLNGDFVKAIAKDSKLGLALQETIQETVANAAWIQSLKGILTAGVVRSYKYAMEKRRKYTQAKK